MLQQLLDFMLCSFLCGHLPSWRGQRSSITDSFENEYLFSFSRGCGEVELFSFLKVVEALLQEVACRSTEKHNTLALFVLCATTELLLGKARAIPGPDDDEVEIGFGFNLRP